MSSIITEWREAVVAHLAATFDGATARPGGDPTDLYPQAEVAGGKREGVSRRAKPLIAVYWPGWEWLERDQALATPKLVVSYWPSRSKVQSSETPRDPSELEQAGVDLMTAFQPKQKVGDFVSGLSCALRNVTPDYADDVWKVEGELVGFTAHLARNAA